MRDPASGVQKLRNLRFALDVMEERSHIGLDDETARTVQDALQHQIFMTEMALSSLPSAQTVEPSTEEVFIA